MNYFDRLVEKARTIDTLEISDILEIVVRDFKRYNVPDEEINKFVLEYVIPMKCDSEKIKAKFVDK